MRGYPQLAALAIGLLVVQVLMHRVLPEALCPDLILIFAVAMGIRAGGAGGLVLAFGAGLLVDMGLAGAQPGLYALLRGTACALTRVADRALYLRAGGPWALYAGCYVVIDALLLGLVGRAMMQGAAIPWGDLLWRSPAIAVLTGLAAVPVLSLVQRLDADGADAVWGLVGSRSR
jgi:rod shape-determining protein MreD